MFSETVLRMPSPLGTHQNRKPEPSDALLQSPNRGGLGAISPGGRAAAALRGGDNFPGTIQAARDPLLARRAAGGAFGSVGVASGREMPTLELGAGARFERAYFADSRMDATASAPLSGRLILKPDSQTLSCKKSNLEL